MDDRQPQFDSSREWRIILLLGAIGGGFLLCVLVLMGAGIWFVGMQLDQARMEDAGRQVEAEQQAAEIEREQAAAKRLAAAEKQGNPGQPSGSKLPPAVGAPALSPPVRNDGRWGLDPNETPAEPKGPPLPKFEETVNPYKPGTQTKLRALRSVPLPKLPAQHKPGRDEPYVPPNYYFSKIAFSPKHELLFALSRKSLWTYDLKAGKELAPQTAKEAFSDLSLSPDQSMLFVADYGGENTGYGTPLNPSWVHRFGLAAGKWEARKAPKIAYRLETVDASRFLLLEQDQWVDLTLNKWEEDGVGIRELSRGSSGYHGDIEYDPRTGRIFHGDTGSSSQEVQSYLVNGNKLMPNKGTGSYGTAQGGGPTTVLAQDGSRLFYGKVQLNGSDLKKQETMVEPIYAASRDIAFARNGYFRATTGSKLGEFNFKLVAIEPDDIERFDDYGWGSIPVISVSPDGMSVWVIDRGSNAVRQFALEGDK